VRQVLATINAASKKVVTYFNGAHPRPRSAGLSQRAPAAVALRGARAGRGARAWAARAPRHLLAARALGRWAQEPIAARAA